MANANYNDWLKKANDDLNWARASIESKIYYGACFAAQQAAEKALKAYLLFKGESLKKAHDLVMLVDEAGSLDETFGRFRKDAARLSQYYVETRYPDIGDFGTQTEGEAKEAIDLAQEIVSFIEKKLG